MIATKHPVPAGEDDLIIDTGLLQRFDRPGPRYTSYPTADRFEESFGPPDYRHALERRSRSATEAARPLSLYVHLPFCDTICYYCACNKIITRDHGRSAKYLRYIRRELDLVHALIPEPPLLTQLHWGGGSPTFLNAIELEELMGIIRERVRMAGDGEYSIEVDPRSADADIIRLLGALGFNRLSVGVQDFDADVQRAVNRIQSVAQTRDVIDAARESGFRSVSMDLIYGLPYQNPDKFSRTLDRVVEIGPDRIALYNYAHLPDTFKPQRRIRESDLPSPGTRIELLTAAIRRFTREGYVYIGMDHFARPSDELAVAQRRGALHRNFQGYSTRAECDLIGLGISAIGSVGSSYVQNVRTLDDYYQRLDAGVLPVLRGLKLTPDDQVRRAVIQTLMCQFAVYVEDIEAAHRIDFRSYFANELVDLVDYQALGLVEIDERQIRVTARGRLIVRAICMVFDQYLRQGRQRARYSRVI